MRSLRADGPLTGTPNSSYKHLHSSKCVRLPRRRLLSATLCRASGKEEEGEKKKYIGQMDLFDFVTGACLILAASSCWLVAGTQAIRHGACGACDAMQPSGTVWAHGDA